MDDELKQVPQRNTGPQRGQLAVVDPRRLAGQEIDADFAPRRRNRTMSLW